jgi:hypothetical protein
MMRATPYKIVRDRLAKVIPKIVELADTTMDKEVLSAFLSPIASVCTPKSSPMTPEQLTALNSSIVHIKSKKLTKEHLIANANRLIANWHLIRDNTEIPEWIGEEEFSDIGILALHRKPEVIKGKMYFKARIRTYTGLCAGLVFDVLLSGNSIAHFFRSGAGVSRYNCSLEEISGMEAVAVVAIRNNRFTARLIMANGRQQSKNKELIEARTNPRKCKRPIPCHVCKANVQQCPLAIWVAEEKENEQKTIDNESTSN